MEVAGNRPIIQLLYHIWGASPAVGRNILPLKKASTQAFYRDVIYRHLLPAFSNQRLCDLVRAEIQGFITAETQRYAWSTVQGIRVTVNLILDPALDWDYLSENPARSIKMPRRQNRPDLVVLSLAEIGRLLQELKEPYQTMVSMAVLTGMRRCELFALRWSDVDFDQLVIHVRQRVYRNQIDTPKGRGSIRNLPLPSGLTARLLALRDAAAATPPGLVFPGRKGKPLSATTVARRVLKPALQKLGLPEVSWHGFRRTLGTWMREQNVHVKTIQEQLGHANAATTLDLYVGSLSDERRRAIERDRTLAESNCTQMDPNGVLWRFGSHANSMRKWGNGGSGTGNRTRVSRLRIWRPSP